MRKLLIALALFTLGGMAPTAQAKLRVVATLQDFASIAQAVGGDRIEVDAIAKGYQDPHFVDAKPSLILKLSKADLVLVAGLELEIGYLPPMLDQSRNVKIHPGNPGYLDLSAGCEVLQRPTGQVTRAMGDVHPYGNPHYWTDPENGRRIARAIAARLSQLDAGNAAAYQAGLAAFEAKLTEKERAWNALMAPFAGAEIVTFHDSWPNFAKAFKLVVVGHIEPKPGIPPTPQHTLEIVNVIQREKIKAILVEPYFDTKTPKFIAGKTGATLVMAYPSVGGVPEITDYFALFDVNLKALASALGGARP